jgi:hypothetical protein
MGDHFEEDEERMVREMWKKCKRAHEESIDSWKGMSADSQLARAILDSGMEAMDALRKLTMNMEAEKPETLISPILGAVAWDFLEGWIEALQRLNTLSELVARQAAARSARDN